MKIRNIAIAGALAMSLTACNLASSEVNEIGLIYSDGITEEKEFVGILDEGSTNTSIGLGDKVYYYPTDQRTWVSGQDAPNVSVVSKDEVRLNVPYEIYFTLNTETETLVEFHEDIGVKVKAYTDAGWVEMLNTYFGRQVDRAMDEVANNYDWRALRSDNEVREAFQRDVVQVLRRNMNNVIGGDYFCGPDYSTGGVCGDFTFTVGKPEPLDDALVRAIEAEQTNQANVDAQRAENLRIEAELEARRSEVELYGPEVYAYLQCIEAGLAPCIPIGANVPVEMQRVPLTPNG